MRGQPSLTASFFSRHPCGGRGPVTLLLGLGCSVYRDLARLRRASALLPEAGSYFFACPKKSNHRDGGNAKEKGTPAWRWPALPASS